MTILVLGSTGQVGNHLRQLLPDAIYWGRLNADLNQPAGIEHAATRVAPNLIINCAAYTAVDRAESESAIAWRINAESTAALARVAAELDVPMIYLSTDYVFDGASQRAYRESDAVAPLNVYGKTKLAGELAVTTLSPKHWIVRTSWVFSAYSNNFVKTMLRLAREREELNIVDDQWGRPSYAGDLAKLIVGLVQQADGIDPLPWGIYHSAGGPETTWYRFAHEILTRAHRAHLIPRLPRMNPITTAEYHTAAQRPMHSVLADNPQLADRLQHRGDWSAGLDRLLEDLSER